LREGHGVYIDEISGEKFKGEWQNGLMHGMGKFSWPDGSRYEGE